MPAGMLAGSDIAAEGECEVEGRYQEGRVKATQSQDVAAYESKCCIAEGERVQKRRPAAFSESKDRTKVNTFGEHRSMGSWEGEK